MTHWTPKRIEEALALFHQIGRDVDERNLPQVVYEAYAKTFKIVATEVGVFDDVGRIFLKKRPSFSDNPAEPWPDVWHVPGVRHGRKETFEDAAKRLIKEDFGGLFVPSDFKYVKCLELTVPPVGLELSFDYICLSKNKTLPGGEFFSTDALPEDIIPYHKDTLIPTLARHFRKKF